MKKIAIINGGMPYEKFDIKLSLDRITDAFEKLGYLYKIFEPSNDIRVLHDIEAYGPDLCYVLDSYYVEEVDGEFVKFDYRSTLDKIDVLCTGSSMESAAICLDKLEAKKYVKELNIMTPESITVRNETDLLSINFYPIILKPINEGEGKDVYLCNNDQEAIKYIHEMLKKYSIVMAEEYIDGLEINVGVLGNANMAKALIPVELEFLTGKIYDYTAKSNHYSVIHHVPARVNNVMIERISNISEAIYQKLKCNGITRIDYRVRGNEIYFLEINTQPSLSHTANIGAAIEKMGWNFETLVNSICTGQASLLHFVR
ncbi:MAG: ATP-grasp domain-containing protein [Eubacterium sp.]